MAKRRNSASIAPNMKPRNPLAAPRPRRPAPEKMARPRSAKRASSPVPADAPSTSTSTTSAAIATADRRPAPPDWRASIVEQLRGDVGALLAGMIKGHALAPTMKKGSGPTAHQLAQILESSETSKWGAAAEAVAAELAEQAAITTREAEVIAESITAEPMQHFARCEPCKAGVHFTPFASGNGFAIVTRNGYDHDTTFGIGPNNIPVCPVDGHGEMQLADDQLRPAHQAITEAAAKANGSGKAEQRKLPLPINEPNWKAMQLQTNELRREVRQKMARWKAQHDAAATLKKHADEAQTRLSEWEDTCDTREREWQEHLEREAEKAARAAEEAAETEDELRGGPVPIADEPQPEAAGASA